MIEPPPRLPAVTRPLRRDDIAPKLAVMPIIIFKSTTNVSLPDFAVGMDGDTFYIPQSLLASRNADPPHPTQPLLVHWNQGNVSRNLGGSVV